MKFFVSRSSDLFGGKKPCEEATSIIIPPRGVFGEQEKWTIEINTLEELIEFQNKYGQIIIVDTIYDCKEIEIYDTYRE